MDAPKVKMKQNDDLQWLWWTMVCKNNSIDAIFLQLSWHLNKIEIHGPEKYTKSNMMMIMMMYKEIMLVQEEIFNKSNLVLHIYRIFNWQLNIFFIKHYGLLKKAKFRYYSKFNGFSSVLLKVLILLSNLWWTVGLPWLSFSWNFTILKFFLKFTGRTPKAYGD